MSIRAANWTSAQLRRIARRQLRGLKPRRRPIPPDEQLRRFQAGEEVWRLEQGLVTPEEWQQYEREMLRRMGGR